MNSKMTYLVCFALLVGTVNSVQALVTVTTADGNGADTYLSNDGQGSNYGPDSVHGEDTSLRAFRQLEGVRSKAAYIRFDLTNIAGDMSGATLTFEATFLKGSSKTVDVYGLKDGDDDFWDESTTTYNNAPGLLAATLGNYALDTAKMTLLGTITTPAVGGAYPVSFSSNPANLPLTSFLDADTNKLVTFLFIGTDNEGEFASKEHETFNPPTLTLPNAVIGVRTSAAYPDPANEASDVVRDVVLSWSPGGYAVKHDVYLGMNFDDVNTASATVDPTGVYKGRQDPNHYPATGTVRLQIGETYYWRIDGVGEAPGNEIYRGKVWQFKIEPYSFAIDGATIDASASSSVEGKGPENTVDGSGLDETGLLHGNIGEGTMWLSAEDANEPAWIKYDLGRVYKLDEMWVWNSNESLELWVGIGFKEVVIDYSVDGIEFKTLGTTHEFNQATGQPDYAHNTTIDFNGISARYVRLTAKSNFKSMLDQYSLSEVRFFYVPVQARALKPDLEATDVPLDVTLTWIPGRQVASHNVYMSTNEQEVIDGTALLDTVTGAEYGPLSLDYATTYYWRVDEVNDIEDPALVEGDIWSFTTRQYVVIDDFEIYNAEDNQIWYAWNDGLGYGTPEAPPYYPGNGTGSAVGDETTDSFTEETIVHEGSQSMPFAFDNNKQNYAKYSEAEFTLTYPRDWTEGGLQELSLWFRGNPASVGSFMEAPAGTYTMTAAGTDIFGVADEFHFAYKMLTGVGTIEARVLSVEQTDVWANAGVMIRETLEPGSKFAAVIITPTNTDGTPTQGCRFRARVDTDGAATSDTNVATAEQTAITAPYWVKIERDVTGNIRGYYSADGTNWQLMAWRPGVTMASSVYIGLSVTAHNATAVCEAKFSNVRTTGTVSGQWAHQDIGILSNDSEPMYVAVSNSVGGSVVVEYDDPAATQIDTWTEWVIGLQELADQGLNLADVDKIAIGIGTKGNTTVPGGSGKMFFDDIRLYGPRNTASEE
jgi:hypothetical protein